ncbi:hypothetical protein PU560_15205 [Georgenia sp. 10Sc9-8]|uniref:DUF308 domain-containing protein n=1 Tax=Georgenia halotolerans TaxID=3028317 RepID=A0ABT5U0F9_9MICO|nr:hypothetical protein [Georgenia halotolerans]
MAGPTRGGADGPLDDDAVQARWAEITAHLGELGTPPAPTGEEPAPTPPRAPSGPRDYAVDEDEDEDDGFEPPDPGPVRATDPVVVLGWAAVAGSLLALIVLPLAWSPLPGLVVTTVIAVLVAGAGLLLWRMPRSRDDDGLGGRGGGAVL